MSLPPPYNALMGIDIGGTKIAGGIVDGDTGKVIIGLEIPTGASDGGPAVLKRALDVGRRLMTGVHNGDAPEPLAIGIGAGGQIDAEAGVVLSATDLLPGWAGTRLRDAFEAEFRLPASADNDVNALASGESRWGAGQGLFNLLYLALGTGVGGGIVTGGRLHRSARGVSGELGHLILDPHGPICTCGGRGCWEQFVSGPALLRRFHALDGNKEVTDGKALHALAQAAPEGPAARAIAQTGEYLGIGLVSLVNIFGPDRIIVGGGLAALGNDLLEPARRVLAQRALPAVRNVPVVTAGLGPDASVAGAASLALLTSGVSLLEMRR